MSQDREGNPVPNGMGRLCEWVEDPNQPANAFNSFGAYQRTLELSCQEGQPGVIQWTPDSSTPDTVYYQVGHTGQEESLEGIQLGPLLGSLQAKT